MKTLVFRSNYRGIKSVGIMPLLDAEWDPITGKVVYRDSSAATTARTVLIEAVKENDSTNSGNADHSSAEHCHIDKTNTTIMQHNNAQKEQSTPRASSMKNSRRRSRSSKKDDKKLPSFEWRTDESVPAHRNENNPRNIHNHACISPSKFHHSGDTKDALPPYQIESTIQILRNEQMYERRAFKELTCYQSFPLQDQAMKFCYLQQTQFDPSYECDSDQTNNIMGDQNSLSSSSSSSSSGGVTSSSSSAPEPKRLVRATNMSPNACTMIQQYRNQFISERSIPSKSITPTTTTSKLLGTALYCLEPRIFAIESKKSKSQHVSSCCSTSNNANNNNNSGGRRRYVVAHIGRFMEMYWCKTEPEWRHAYELIPPYTPCRLYLDIECTDHPDLISNGTSTTSSSTGLTTVQILQQQLLIELYEELAIELNDKYGQVIFHCPTTGQSYQIRPLQLHDIVDLDSSTETKFSRHWIVHIPVVRTDETTTTPMTSSTDSSASASPSLDLQSTEVLFPDNATIGTFVRQWVGRLAEQQATGQLLSTRKVLHQYLFLPKKPNNNNETDHSSATIDRMSCLIDMGVYTKNRLFRLLGSMKYGKPITAAFRIADTNQFPFRNGFGNDSFYIPAMEQNKQPHNIDTIQQHPTTGSSFSSPSTSASSIKKSLSKTDWRTHADALAQTFVVPINVAKIDFPILPRFEIPLNGSTTNTRSSKFIPSQPQRSAGYITSSASILSSTGKSPYPMVDQYILEHLANRGGTLGMIRAWSIQVDPTTSSPILISYQMCRNRYCECIGREHKGNNIIWNCNVLSMECFQTCHDPDCRALNFRGQSIPLPIEVQDELRDAFFEEHLARLDIMDHPSAAEEDFAAGLAGNVIDNVPVDTDDDDESSFDKALAALNINDLVTPSELSPISVGDVVRSKHTNDSHSSMEQQVSIMYPIGKTTNDSIQEIKKNTITTTRNSSSLDSSKYCSDDDDDDDDTYNELYRLALEIDARKKKKQQQQQNKI